MTREDASTKICERTISYLRIYNMLWFHSITDRIL